jgi:hypothetical protein
LRIPKRQEIIAAQARAPSVRFDPLGYWHRNYSDKFSKCFRGQPKAIKAIKARG